MILNRDAYTLRDVIRSAPNLTQQNIDDILVAAVVKGDKPLYSLALRRGANPQSVAPAAFNAATKYRQLEFLQDLLERVPNNLTAKNEALLIAADDQNESALRLLLDCGADVNYGFGAAFTAVASAGNLKLVKWFVERGAEFGFSDPVFRAADQKHFDVVDYLLDHTDSPGPLAGQTMVLAATAGRIATVKRLFAKGFDVTVWGQEALYAAVAENHGDLVELFLEKGYNPDADDQAALRIARRKGFTAIAVKLERAIVERAGKVSPN